MPARVLTCFILFLATMSKPSEADAQQGRDLARGQLAPLRYTLSFPAPHTHYVEVEARVPTDRHPVVELDMAVWTPGSYLVREYARNVEQVTAESGGKSLGVTKTLKNRWRIETGGAPEIVVRYRVYGREMTVRTNFVDADFAIAERRADVPHAGRRSRSAAPRGHAATAPGVEDVDLGVTRRTRRRRASLSRTRLRHAGRFADPRRQPGHLHVHGAGDSPLHRQRRRRRHLGWAEDGRRRPEDRRDGRRLLGHGSVREVRLLQSDHGSERRARAQERLHADDEPLESHGRDAAMSTGSRSSATSSSTRGTSSAFDRPSSDRSTTTARTRRDRCGSPRGSRATTAICLQRAPASSPAMSILASWAI